MVVLTLMPKLPTFAADVVDVGAMEVLVAVGALVVVDGDVDVAVTGVTVPEVGVTVALPTTLITT